MKILLVYPLVSETFWSFKHALRVVRRKAAFPPLGALTVAAMLPDSWQKKLVDINVRALEDQDILWADYVFISAMIAQKDSARQVADRCRALGVKVVGGGPLFRAYPDDFADLDHLVFGEAESIISELVTDLESGPAQEVLSGFRVSFARRSSCPHVGPHQSERLCVDVHSVFQGMSIQLRIL